jgi:hypothetical protein
MNESRAREYFAVWIVFSCVLMMIARVRFVNARASLIAIERPIGLTICTQTSVAPDSNPSARNSRRSAGKTMTSSPD